MPAERAPGIRFAVPVLGGGPWILPESRCSGSSARWTSRSSPPAPWSARWPWATGSTPGSRCCTSSRSSPQRARGCRTSRLRSAPPHPSASNPGRELAQFVEPFLGEGVPIETRVVEGDPWRVIRDEALALPADLLVMGTHGRSGFEHLLLGSVTEKVLRRAPCPVLTLGAVPRPREGVPCSVGSSVRPISLRVRSIPSPWASPWPRRTPRGSPCCTRSSTPRENTERISTWPCRRSVPCAAISWSRRERPCGTRYRTRPATSATSPSGWRTERPGGRSSTSRRRWTPT